MAITAKTARGKNPWDGDSNRQKMTKEGKKRTTCSGSDNSGEEGANETPQNTKTMVGNDLHDNAGENDGDTSKKKQLRKKGTRKISSKAATVIRLQKKSRMVKQIWTVLPKKTSAKRSEAPAKKVIRVKKDQRGHARKA